MRAHVVRVLDEKAVAVCEVFDDRVVVVGRHDDQLGVAAAEDCEQPFKQSHIRIERLVLHVYGRALDAVGIDLLKVASAAIGNDHPGVGDEPFVVAEH